MRVALATAPPKRQWPTVPKLAPGGTVLCVASGPSLTAEDVEYCRTRVDAAVVVNNGYQLAPWATALYAADWLWWQWHRGAPSFHGLKYSLTRQAGCWPGVEVLRKTGDEGLETDPSGLRTGRNSGYQAMNLAVHLGASRIVLLGYDMQRGPKGESHWHGDHPNHVNSPFPIFTRKFETLVGPLSKRGITVVNCSRETALRAFPRMRLEDAL